MDYQNRAGSKFGGGGVASSSATNADRRERLRKLALETIDLDKDPYFFKNHVGAFECRLCLTVHQNDGSYLAHTQGRKHQTNLARRQAREDKQKEREGGVATGMNGIPIRKQVIKIGRPGYNIKKIRDPVTRQNGLVFQVQYPELPDDTEPKVRFMSAFEQQIEEPDNAFQYMVIAAEPYDKIAFKIESGEIDRTSGKAYWTWYNRDTKEFWAQLLYKGFRELRFDPM